MSRSGRAAIVLCGLLAAVAAVAPPAGAKPRHHSDVPPPPATYRRTAKCVSEVTAAPTPVPNGVSWGQAALRYTAAWKFSEGRGVKVAMIDTGVNPGPEFGSRLSGLADLVLPHDPLASGAPPGLFDCDGHGTLVAGIIAAAPDSRSGFAGVAPQATIMSIRQSSENYQSKREQNTGSTGQPIGAGTPRSLADAIIYAARHHAGVINISVADCGHAGDVDRAYLTAAVETAVRKYDAVVVAAAGNLSSDGPCSRQNTPGRPPTTVATPADVHIPGVLAVAAVQRDGQPAAFSLAGSWVDVAAPGTEIISTDPYPGGSGQVDTVVTSQGRGSIQGTSFAAPYVSGVAALVRSRFPDRSAAWVARRIETTAAHPAGGRNDYVGYGMVDPVAALTAVPPGGADPHHPQALTVRHPTPVSTRPRTVALWGTLGVAVAVALLAVVVLTRRSRRTSRPSPG